MNRPGDPIPPRWATRFLHWYCREELLEEIEGDLLELYYMRVEAHSLRYANLHYTWDVVRFIRRYTLRKPQNRPSLNTIPMWKNYLKVSWRHLLRQKGFAALNVLGLAVGLAACLLIMLFVDFEHSYDDFHAAKDRLYIATDLEYKTGPLAIDSSLFAGKPEHARSNYWLPTPLRDVLKDELSQVRHATRYATGVVVAYLGREPVQQQVMFTDPDFFRMFSLNFLEGLPATALGAEHEIVITREAADTYLGKGPALGKTIRMVTNGEETDFVVSGVVKKLPPNSILGFEVALRSEHRQFFDKNAEDWDHYNIMTILETQPGVSEANLMAGLEEIKDKYLGEYAARVKERAGFTDDTEGYYLKATPFADAHLNRYAAMSNASDPVYSFLLGGIALIILLVASINYVSLTLSRSAGRNMEVGMRKSLGATRGSVFGQFLGESLMIALFAMLLALGLVWLCLPWFGQLTGKQLSMHPAWTGWWPLAIAGVVGLTGLAAGMYPAAYFARFKTAMVLKGRSSANIRSGFMRGLVIFQFSLCVFLLVCCFAVYRQLDYVLQKDLGFNVDQVVMLEGYPDEYPAGAMDKLDMLRTRLGDDPDIAGITGTSLGFGKGWSQVGFDVDGKELRALNYRADHAYMEVLDMELLKGRNFSQSPGADKKSIIVNQALVKEMGWEDPIGKTLPFTEGGNEVIGVVKDFHAQSLESEVKPLILHQDPDADGVYAFYIRLEAGTLARGLDKLRATWKDIAPDKPFTYTFLDQDVKGQYHAYLRWRSILSIAAMFAIVIACLGLFGLSGVNAVNRTKEIGIRKVMGARVGHLIWLLNRETLALVGLALAIGIPPAVWTVSGWMENFSYTTSLNVLFYLMCGGCVAVVAILAVSYHAFRAASSDPVRSLRYE